MSGATRLFIGGSLHGEQRVVQSSSRDYRMPKFTPVKLEINRYQTAYVPAPEVEHYRLEPFYVDGVLLVELMVHESVGNTEVVDMLIKMGNRIDMDNIPAMEARSIKPKAFDMTEWIER